MTKLTSMILALALVLASCKKEYNAPLVPTTPPVNEEEVITTLVITFTDDQTFEDHVFRFTDLDGDGGNAPVITTDELPSNRNYIVSLSLLNESTSPVTNTTQQILDEPEAHQFFFMIVDADLTMSYADLDADGAPLGLLNNASTTTASSGTLRVTLRHGPNKGAAGVATGDITNAGGETDIEVTFPVTIV